MNEEIAEKMTSRMNMYPTTGGGNFTALDEIIEIANKYNRKISFKSKNIKG